MDEHGVPEDPGPSPASSDGPILDPREARYRFRRRTPPSAGLAYLQSLSARERVWMRRMVVRIAYAYHVDADDLMQELQLGLLACETIDAGRESVRAYLAQRARWRAADMLRGDSSHQQHAVPLDVVPEPAAPEPRGPDPDWTLERVRALGLSRDEAQVLLLLLWGMDLPLKDFSEVMQRGYAKTRQDKSRGLRRIAELFELEPAESAAFMAYRKYGTMTAAAVRLNVPVEEMRVLVRRAEAKINQKLEHAPRPRTAHPQERDTRHAR
jgi:DNA-directed RNA polymerase specialized sigma24 family protein